MLGKFKSVVSADAISAEQLTCGDLIYCTDIDTLYLFDGEQRIAIAAAPQLPNEPLAAVEPLKHYSNAVSRCPQCGAPHNEHERQCPYCGSYFVAACAASTPLRQSTSGRNPHQTSYCLT